MEPLYNLKRSYEHLDKNECLVCQQTKSDVKRSSQDSFLRLVQAAKERNSLQDHANKPTIDRILFAESEN